MAAPGYWVFALGFLLWGLKSALTSGALEALVYEELQRLGATEQYATLMGRGQVAGVLAAMCSGAVAAPVIAPGGFAAVGAASVAVVPAGLAGRNAVPGEQNPITMTSPNLVGRTR